MYRHIASHIFGGELEKFLLGSKNKFGGQLLTLYAYREMIVVKNGILDFWGEGKEQFWVGRGQLPSKPPFPSGYVPEALTIFKLNLHACKSNKTDDKITKVI